MVPDRHHCHQGHRQYDDDENTQYDSPLRNSMLGVPFHRPAHGRRLARFRQGVGTMADMHAARQHRCRYAKGTSG